MKYLPVLLALFGLALGQDQFTTPWPEHDCRTDHEAIPGQPTKFRSRGSDGWADRSCNPPHLIFNLSADCKCLWPNPELTYGDCNTVNKPVPGEPAHIFQYWHPVDNVWYQRNCHDVFPINYQHNDDQLFFNVTSCACDWLPEEERGPLTVGPLPDCTVDMDIPMIEQPPLDALGSFVQPYNPVWKVWPPLVLLEIEDNRQAIRFQETRLKSWFLEGNEKPNIWMYFGLKATPADDNNNFRVVLDNGCARLKKRRTIIHQGNFKLWYRATNMAFRIEYRNGTWECNPGGSGVNKWVDVTFHYHNHASGPILCTDFVPCDLRQTNPEDPPIMKPDGDDSGSFRLDNGCQLNLGGAELSPDDKFTGYMSRFRELSGGKCTCIGMPTRDDL